MPIGKNKRQLVIKSYRNNLHFSSFLKEYYVHLNRIMFEGHRAYLTTATYLFKNDIDDFYTKNPSNANFPIRRVNGK